MLKKLLFLTMAIAVSLGASFAQVEETCSYLSPASNLISDPEVSDLANFGGWGNKAVNTDLDYVYCGLTSGKVWATNGGSIDTKGITMKKDTPYLLRARVYVKGTGKFQFGILGGGDLIQTTKNDEWELVESLFIPKEGSTGLYFNCQNRGGTEGYVDNWELYEWSKEGYDLYNLVKRANAAYNAELDGATEFKTAIDNAEAFMLTLTGDNVLILTAEVNSFYNALFQEFTDFAALNASPDNPIELTYFITNPSFEDVQGDKVEYFPGWTKVGAANSEYCTRNNAGPAAFKTGNVYFQYWSSSKPDYSISQELAGLPEGIYELKADAGGDPGTIGTFVFANEKKVEVTKEKDTYTLNLIIMDGNVTIGFKSVSRNVNFSYTDNFRLIYKGSFNDLIDFAKGIVGEMALSVQTQLQDAIDDAEAAILDGSQVALELAHAGLSSAITAANNSITAYESLKAVIDEAKALKNTLTNGNEDFNADIDMAEDVYGEATSDDEELDIVILDLQKAMVWYKAANASDSFVVDMTIFVTNSDFEQSAGTNHPGWTNPDGVSTYSGANTVYTGSKSPNIVADNTVNGSLYQTLSGLPQGFYQIRAVARGASGGVMYIEASTGTWQSANTVSVQVNCVGDQNGELTNGWSRFTTPSIYLTEDQDLIIGERRVSGNWRSSDAYELHYFGDVGEPVITASTVLLFLNETVTQKTFSVSGINVTNDITFSAGSVAGITFNPSSIAKDDENLATGITVTATFNPAAEGAATASGNITVSSTDAESKNIPIVTSKDSECFTPLASGNLAPDPTFIDATQMLGWGSRSLVIDPTKAYCGAGVGFSNGGSYDQRILWEGNMGYLVRAMIHANGTDVKLGVYGIGKTDIEAAPVDKDNWELVEYGFTTGASPTTTGGVFLNGAGATGAYIDNLEVYKAWVVTFNSNEGSVVDPQYVIDGTKAVTPEAPTKENAVFNGWFADSELSVAYDFDAVVTGDAIVYAAWTEEGGNSVNNPMYSNFKIRPAIDGVYFITEEAQTVKVVSVIGQIVKQIDVTAGETFIPLNSSIYIINKQKVVVK